MKIGNALLPPQDNPVLFFTATILNWNRLLTADKYKEVIISSLHYMSEKQRMKIGGFVIMPNHIHILFRPGVSCQLKDIQRDLLKFTAQQIKGDLEKHHPEVLAGFVSTQKDRRYQIWERRPLAVALYSIETIKQKLDYIHNNPCQEKWQLSETVYDYHYSSASFYERGDIAFPFLKHYLDI